jgi:uncharacterized protein YdeI (YjbR/CyaY-like superfamily)
MKPKYFSDASKFRGWLEKNHSKKKELVVGFYKKSSGKPSINWPESVEQAICFGWIDGIRRSIDKNSYSIRFTPRSVKSIWSAKNIETAKKLIKTGLIKSAGLVAYKNRDAQNSKIYSFEQRIVQFDLDYEKIFKKNIKAWNNFQFRPRYYRKAVTYWVMSAKKEETRVKRLRRLIKDSEVGLKIKEMRIGGKQCFKE